MTKIPKPIVPEKNIIIFSGHYGSGKTENALNYSLHLSSLNLDISLIDLDIINLYFRSREVSQVLEDNGVTPILPKSELQQVDFPIINPRIKSALTDPQGKVIVDLGGDPDGAIPLGSFKQQIVQQNYEMWLVVNPNRAQSSTVSKTIQLANNIELTSRLKITGLINNTHMKEETTLDEVIKGLDFCKQLTQNMGIPLVYSAVRAEFISDIKEYIKTTKAEIGCVLPIKNYLKAPWEDF